MKKQLISMVLMAAMTVSMLTGCETADGKKTEAPSSENQAAAEVKAEDEGKASEGRRGCILAAGNWRPQRAVITI